MNKIECEIAIVGGGGSGMFLASMLCEKYTEKHNEKKVCIFSSTKVGESSTAWAKGGINAVLKNPTDSDDKWQHHAFDTIKSGRGLSSVPAVERMCKIAPKIISCLLNIGVELETDANKKPLQRQYGGQRLNYGKGNFAHRACYSKDKTGKAIANALQNFICNKTKNSPQTFNAMHLLDVKYTIEQGGERTISSVIFCNTQTNTMHEVFARHFVFASGGYSGVYGASTCSAGAIGYVPLALLVRAGAVFMDSEFVQFHPTGMYKFSTLVSEACRAEGGYLENAKGERFMQKYDPHNMELAPRDTISKAIFNEMKLCGENFVYLNLTHLQEDFVKAKLENACKNAMLFCNINITKQRLKICPVAHYSMGGIAVDESYQMLNFTNAFAIGELACGSVHGANRLGCNSLLELFYSAIMCFKKVCFKQVRLEGFQKTHPPLKPQIYSSAFKFSNAKPVDGLVNYLKSQADVNLAIEKSADSVNQMLFATQIAMDEFETGSNAVEPSKAALKDMFLQHFKAGMQSDEIFAQISGKQMASDNNIKQPDVIDIAKCVEFFSLHFVLQAMCASSLARQESRGSFYRSDFPSTSPAFAKNSQAIYNAKTNSFAITFTAPIQAAKNNELNKNLS